MDPIRQPSGRYEQPDSDTDLANILYRSGRTIKQIFRAIYYGLAKLLNGILLTILFLLRNIIWIILATVLGLGYGIFLLNKNGAKYQSQMIVKANFNSSRAIFNTIDYLNAVRGVGEMGQLGKIFGISASEAMQLESFSVEPVESEIITAEMYKDLFIRNTHGDMLKKDTIWLRTVNYENFKRSLTKYDYPYYEISAVATNPLIFSKLGNGLIRQVSDIPLLKEARDSQVITNHDEEKLIKGSISSIDTLRQAYNERLVKGQTGNPENNQLTVMQNATELKTPELDLYDKLLDLQEELRKIRSRSVTEKNVIEVYSPFNATGQKVSFFKQSVVTFGFYGFGLSILILLLISLYRILVKLEKRKPLA